MYSGTVQVATLVKECADVKHPSFGVNASYKADFVDQEQIANTASDALISKRLVHLEACAQN